MKKPEKKILEALEEMDKKLSDEKKAFVNEEIAYQAEKIMELKGENEELVDLITRFSNFKEE